MVAGPGPETQALENNPTREDQQSKQKFSVHVDLKTLSSHKGALLPFPPHSSQENSFSSPCWKPL